MNWIEVLYQTYLNNSGEVNRSIGNENTVMLLPICHTTQNAHIEIVLDSEGNFVRARVLEKYESRTMIPCTEESGGRTSGIRPHPLHDKLQYISPDWATYARRGTLKLTKDTEKPYSRYLDLLSDWCASPYGIDKVRSVNFYARKGELISDLLKADILHLDENGTFLEKLKDNANSSKKSTSSNALQEDSFVRFRVEIPGDPCSALWEDVSIVQSWIDYYISTKTEKAFCHVKGTILPITYQHPAKIRNTGDKAKLISSNDSSNFTYRGRFVSPDQTAGISYEVSQKAHSALRWLIEKQGYRNGNQAIVAWATNGAPLPKPTDTIIDWEGGAQDDEEIRAYTDEVFANKLKQRIAGYGSRLEKDTKAIVIALDSASPGRLSIVFYREIDGSEFLSRLESWHNTCSWKHTYRTKENIDANGRAKRIGVTFFGAPAPKDIAEAAYGMRIDEKLCAVTVERILPCIIDGHRCNFPEDLMVSVIQRASNRAAFEHEGNDWEWNKILSIACALYRRHMYEKGEQLIMSLDTTRKTRDYLYGRLLAVADVLEERALYSAGESRATNAARMMNRFADRPFSTWRILHSQLTPYRVRLGQKSRFLVDVIQDIENLFVPEEYLDDRPLSGEYLLGYYSQRDALKFKKPSELEDVIETEK